MKFTGERYVPTEQGRIRLEHYHRYVLVLDVVKGKDVLDLACGEGYGSALMSETAKTVTGVDISAEAVRHAAEVYAANKNLSFIQNSAISTGIADASIDVVVSYETIEHLAAQAEMLAEIKRVLRSDGILIISSPNRPVYSEESGEFNEFHVKELDFNEFYDLLKSQFENIEFYGQRIMMGSVIQPLEGSQKAYKAWHDGESGFEQVTGKLIDPVYFVAVCGNTRSSMPTLDATVMYPDNLDLVKHYVGFAKWAQTLELTVRQQETRIVHLMAELQTLSAGLETRDSRIITLNQELAEIKHVLAGSNRETAHLRQVLYERETHIGNLDRIINERYKENQELTSAYRNITSSTSWRVTTPLREIKRWILSPGQQARRYLAACLRIMKQ